MLDVLGPLLVMSLFSKIIESRQFKKYLVGADSPLEFARQTVRLNSDIINRSQAASMIDRLDVANDVISGLKLAASARMPASTAWRREVGETRARASAWAMLTRVKIESAVSVAHSNI